jgi:tetratricopeptide (TPR) repeat protein
VIGGAAATATLAGIGGWTFLSRQRSISPEAQLYLQKGIDELQTNDAFELNNPASLDQAITLLTDATHAAPDSAEAWGALAMAYAARKKASPLAERAGLDARSRSAAKEALSLDRRESRALGALRMLDPVYRHWSDAERADRAALTLQPRMPLLLFLLGDVYASVGRWDAAAALSRKFDRTHFLIAGADRKMVVNLWSSGDLQGADEAMRVAVDHWPRNPYVWRTQIGYLMYSGRPADALTVLSDRAQRPPDTPDNVVQAFETTARALAGDSRTRAIGSNLALLGSSPVAVFSVAHACAALRDPDNLFAILRGYYFREGEWARVAPAGGDEDRATSPLFQPPMRAVWRDRRFDTLVERIGLQDYWRQSRSLPDFRRLS